jgi:DNA-binding winged helix-turn-helix (wHTH) protein
MALYRFDRFEFDSAIGDLQHAGRRVRLRPQPARALEHLLKRHGELVTRAELQRAIWPEGTFVHFDDGLDSCIKQIRAALGGRSAPAYVETLVRRGFRFTAPVTIVSAQEQPGRPRKRIGVLPVPSLGEVETAAHRVARLVEEILASDPEVLIHFLLGVTVRIAGQRMLVTSTLIDARAQELEAPMSYAVAGPDGLEEGRHVPRSTPPH